LGYSRDGPRWDRKNSREGLRQAKMRNKKPAKAPRRKEKKRKKS